MKASAKTRSPVSVPDLLFATHPSDEQIWRSILGLRQIHPATRHTHKGLVHGPGGCFVLDLPSQLALHPNQCWRPEASAGRVSLSAPNSGLPDITCGDTTTGFPLSPSHHSVLDIV